MQVKYVFVDEHHSSFNKTPYSAAVATVWDQDALIPLRSELIQTISDRINAPGVIKAFPKIHGSDMAAGFSDEIKLFCYAEVARLIQKYNVRVYRVGYFDSAPLVSEFDPLGLAISQVCEYVRRHQEGALVYVYELNSSRHKKIELWYNDWALHYHAEVLGEENVTVPHSRMILGRFYCSKETYFMCVTDVASYALVQKNVKAQVGSLSQFKSDVTSKLELVYAQVDYDEIIQVNDYPFKPPGLGPARYLFPITPSDTLDIADQFNMFLPKLKEFWSGKDSE